MAVKWKTSATFYVFCFIVCSNTLVNGIRVQSKRVKGAAKGELRHFTSQLQLTHFCSVQMNSEMKNKKRSPCLRSAFAHVTRPASGIILALVFCCRCCCVAAAVV